MLLHTRLGKTLLATSLLGLALGLSGCKNDEQDDTSGETFALPPMQSFVIDYDALPSDGQSKAAFESLQQLDYSGVSSKQLITDYNALTAANPGSYFTEASVKVLAWKTITDIGLLIPKLAFVSAFNHQPVKNVDGSWEWNYAVGLRHTARLVADVRDQQVHWEMYVSKNDGSLEDFNWYSGQHNLTYTAGTWTLRESADNPAELLDIQWTRDPTTRTGTIKYTNIKTDDPENGGYIYYGSTTPQAAPAYDRFFHIYNKGADNLTEIEWNKDTLVGRMKSPNTVGAEWVYWDENLANAAEPPP